MTNGAISYSTFQDRGTRLRSARRPAGSVLDQRSVGCSFSDGGKPISCAKYGRHALVIQMAPRPDPHEHERPQTCSTEGIFGRACPFLNLSSQGRSASHNDVLGLESQRKDIVAEVKINHGC